MICYLTVNENAWAAQLAQSGIPLISLAATDCESYCAKVTGNASDLYSTAVSHLLEIGVTNIGFLICENVEYFPIYEERWADFCNGNGMIPNVIRFAVDEDALHHPQEIGRVSQTLSQVLLDCDTRLGVLAQQDYVGPYVCRVCRHLGVRVPEDVAIVGADGFDISRFCDPQVTSVRMQLENVGAEAVKIAFQLLAGQDSEKITRVAGASLVTRCSTLQTQRSGIDIPAALDFIEMHACEGITVDDVVFHTQGVSRRWFSDAFKQWVGFPPAQAIRDKKLARVRQLLSESDYSITEIASLCGYCDDVELRKIMTKKEGMSPREYRKIYRNF